MPLCEILRAGARRLIAQAVEAEFETSSAWIVRTGLSDGSRHVVRHGHDPVPRRNPDGGSDGGRARLEGSRSGRDNGRADTLHLEYPAQMGAAHEEPRCAAAGVLYLRGILPKQALQEALFRIARQGRAQLIVGGDRPPRKGGWEDEYHQWQRRGVTGARYASTSSAEGGDVQARVKKVASRMRAGADRRDAGGQEGADRLSDRHAGERAELEGTAGRLESARLGRRAASRHRRWRARVLESPRRGVLDDASSAMLAAQDTQRARQAPEVDATQRAQDLREIWLSPNRAAAEAAMTTFAEKSRPNTTRPSNARSRIVRCC